MYVHTCGTSTVNLANLVFLGASNAEILAFDRAHKEICYAHYLEFPLSNLSRIMYKTAFLLYIQADRGFTPFNGVCSFIRCYRRAAAEMMVQFVGIRGSTCLNSDVDPNMVST
jgi:hypothetical protein